ncbi:MAG: lipopolysaccharide heptosyltransferase II [Candidatus Omnitrophota bacterium]
MAPQRILVVNPFGIGDVLFTTPLIGALKQRYPAASISYIGNARTVPFLKNDSRLERVFCYERDDFVAIYRKSPIRFLRRWFDFAQEIRAGGFDTAFDLSLGSPLALALVWAGIPRRIGYDHKGRGRWLTDKVPLKGYEARHVAAYYLDLLGGTRPAGRMEIFSSDADKTRAAAFRRTHQLTERGFTVIHPGGGASWGNSAGLKRWPAVNFAGLADKMIEKGGLPIILMGDKNEVALCAEVAGLMKHRPILAAGALSLTEAAAVMGAAKLVVANDGGPLHVAVAAGAVTASIFGPVDPVVYGPYPPDTHLVVQKGLACQPCYRRFRMSDCRHQACLKSLSVDEVFNKISRLI